jgi:cell division protein FtsL
MSVGSSSFDDDVDFVVTKHGNVGMPGWQRLSYALLIITVLLCLGTVVLQLREIGEKAVEIEALKNQIKDKDSQIDDLTRQIEHRKPSGTRPN